MNYTEELKKYLELEIKVIESLNLEDINKVMNVLEEARLNNKRIFICGNGGSAATASHFAGDFNKGLSEILDKKYDFECLSDNVAMMMAVANDTDFSQIFVRPLENKMHEGDVFIGISGSGNSENVVKAMDYAKSHGGKTIAIVGYKGGKLKEMADYCIHVAIDDMQISEDVHMIMDHLMMHTLYNYHSNGNNSCNA